MSRFCHIILLNFMGKPILLYVLLELGSFSQLIIKKTEDSCKEIARAFWDAGLAMLYQRLFYLIELLIFIDS